MAAMADSEEAYPGLVELETMVGPRRPQFLLFGSSIVQFSFGEEGWGAILADIYARKVGFPYDLCFLHTPGVCKARN